MSVLVVGSVALDSIETPFGGVQDVLGGSASYFSLAASLFTDVKIVAVVGDDFPEEYTYLNVFENFDPVIPEDYRDAEYVFLANINPELQLHVLKQVKKPKLVACDTMNYWIEKKPKELREVLKNVNLLIINDAEARELAQEPMIIKAARTILEIGPEILIVKRGEYGALMFSKEGIFWAPSYPLEAVVDPTGAGDTFAGGFLGAVANDDTYGSAGLKKAVIYGSVLASFTVEDFGVKRLTDLQHGEIEARFTAFLKLSRLD